MLWDHITLNYDRSQHELLRLPTLNTLDEEPRKGYPVEPTIGLFRRALKSYLPQIEGTIVAGPIDALCGPPRHLPRTLCVQYDPMILIRWHTDDGRPETLRHVASRVFEQRGDNAAEGPHHVPLHLHIFVFSSFLAFS